MKDHEIEATGAPGNTMPSSSYGLQPCKLYITTPKAMAANAM